MATKFEKLCYFEFLRLSDFFTQSLYLHNLMVKHFFLKIIMINTSYRIIAFTLLGLIVMGLWLFFYENLSIILGVKRCDGNDLAPMFYSRRASLH